MNHFLTVFLKEIKDNFRDRRTMMSALVFGPLFGPVIFAVVISITLKQASSAADEPLPIAVVGAEHAPNLIAFLGQQDTEIERLELEPSEAIAAVKRGDEEMVLIIDSAFGDSWSEAQTARVSLVLDNSDNSTSRQARRARGMIGAYASQIGAMRLLARGVDPTLASAIRIDEIDTSTPSTRAALLLGMLSYFLLFSMLAGGMYLAIDSTAGERERGSLEPLLTLPVSRSTLLLGKLTATIFFMCASLVIALIALSLVLGRIPLQELGMSVQFGPKEVITAFFVMAPFALIGASLLTVVTSFTKSFKEAQSYTTFAMLVPTLPIMIAAVMNLKPSLQWMVVPSMSQHLLLLDLVKGEALQPLFIVVSVVSSLLLGAVLAWVAVQLYKRESLLM
ncbi:MAG: ABC transporter permease [Pseudomonadota bacterium]